MDLRSARANMASAVVITFALQEGAKCYSLVQQYLTWTNGERMTQEYIKTQIADTETTGHTLILFMS